MGCVSGFVLMGFQISGFTFRGVGLWDQGLGFRV